MAKQTLVSGHLSPLAPDLLWCHPFKDEDPFILESRPHIYVIGNQPTFETSLEEIKNNATSSVDKTRIILLPRFSQSGTIVIVNTRTLEVIPINFGSN